MTGTVNPPPGPFLPRLPRARGDRTPNDFSFVRASGTEDTRTLENWALAILSGAQVLASRTALKALDTTITTHAFLVSGARSGAFVWRTGDFSALVTADTQEGIYLASDDVATTAGAWVRVYSGALNVEWFGAVGGGADDTAPCQCAIDVATAQGGGTVYFPKIFTVTGSGDACLLVTTGNVHLVGNGMNTSGVYAAAGIPDTRSCVVYRPANPSVSVAGLTIKNMAIRLSSTGLHGLYLDLDNGGSGGLLLYSVEISKCRLTTGTTVGNGLRVDGLTPNGGLAWSHIHDNEMSDAVFSSVGDLIVLDNNIISSSVVGKNALHFWNCSGASNFTVQENLIQCKGAQILCDGGSSPTIIFNELESAVGDAAPDDAMINMRGDVLECYFPLIEGNGVSSLDIVGHSQNNPLYLGNMRGGKVTSNRFGSPAAVKSIIISADADDALIEKNTYYEGGVKKELSVTDSGVGTQYMGRVGTYSPTATIILNLDSVTPSSITNFAQNGKKVDVWGAFAADPTANGTSTSFRTDLPIPCDLTDSAQLGGVGSSAGSDVRITGDATNNAATFAFTSINTVNGSFAFSYSYTLP